MKNCGLISEIISTHCAVAMFLSDIFISISFIPLLCFYDQDLRVRAEEYRVLLDLRDICLTDDITGPFSHGGLSTMGLKHLWGRNFTILFFYFTKYLWTFQIVILSQNISWNCWGLRTKMRPQKITDPIVINVASDVFIQPGALVLSVQTLYRVTYFHW